MDVVIISNGLGNQMSQFSFYTQKKKNHNQTFFIPISNDHNGIELESVFNLDCKSTFFQNFLYYIFRLLLTNKLPFIVKPIQSFLGFLNCKVVYENYDYNFKEEYLLNSKGITFYYGGWHSEKFFQDINIELKNIFTFNLPSDKQNKFFANEILATNSISIHVRRGDFLSPANINLFGDVCNKEYYENAIDLISSKVIKPHFYVFSNDMEWVKSNINVNNVTYVTCNTGVNSWKDMYLMSLCKHNIVANSTFSWWGAWLNSNSNKIVIAPNRFLKSDVNTDVYPDDWIKLSSY